MKMTKGKIIVILIVVAATILGVTAYRAFSTGSVNVLSDIAGAVLTPIQKGIGKLAAYGANYFGYFNDVDRLREENDQLKERVSQLESDLSDFEKYKSENERLKEYLEIKDEHPEFVFEMADVIAREPGNWFDVFTIDKGSLNGLGIQDVVITSEGLVGYIYSVGSNWSKVITILDPQCAVGVSDGRTKEVGIVEGDLDLRDQGHCKMSLLPADNTVQEGDLIVTSGLGGIFPKGLEVGKVLSVQPEPHGISSYAVIQPMVDMGSIKEVMVIKDYR